MSLYLTVLCLFKFGVGALLLLGAWDSMAVSGNAALNICIATALAFVPAAFAKPLVTKFINTDPQKIIGLSGICCAAIVAIISQGIISKPLLAAFYFGLWILLFVIEASSEGWFFTLASNKNQNDVRKLSAISMIAVQIATVLGPISVAALKHLNSIAPYVLIILLFSAIGIISLLSEKILLEKKGSPIQLASNFNRNLYVITFAFIWPAIAIFNMVIPIVAKSTYNSLNIAAAFEFILGGSTIIAGLLLPYLVRRLGHFTLLITSSLISISSAIVFSILNHNIIFGIFSIAALGFSFGVSRIEGRAALSKSFSPAEASTIVATANALSAPLVVLVLFSAFKEYEHMAEASSNTSITLPVVFVISTSLFLYSFIKSGYMEIKNA